MLALKKARYATHRSVAKKFPCNAPSGNFAGRDAEGSKNAYACITNYIIHECLSLDKTNIWKRWYKYEDIYIEQTWVTTNSILHIKVLHVWILCTKENALTQMCFRLFVLVQQCYMRVQLSDEEIHNQWMINYSNLHT